MSLVLDCSATIAWFMPNEQSPPALELLDRVVADGALVPDLWPIEVGNVLLVSVRRRRMSAAHRDRALARLGELPIVRDHDGLQFAWTDTLALADRFRLSLYDATYLELARRRRLPLATLNDELRAAGRALGLAILGS
jgi:predicted nucleic acid-binding protein